MEAMNAEPAALAALDGAMFHEPFKPEGRCNGQPLLQYTEYQCGVTRFLYLDRSKNIDIPSKEHRAGITFSVDAQGTVSFSNGSTVSPNAVVAVQVT